MSADNEHAPPTGGDLVSSELQIQPEHVEPDSDWLEVGNEFATVRVRRVLTRNGARLQVHSSKLGTEVFLDSVLLESLTWQTSESLSLFLQTPLEPFRQTVTDAGDSS